MRPQSHVDSSIALKPHKRSTEESKASDEKASIVYTGFAAEEVEQAAKELKYQFSGVDAPKNKDDFYGLRYAEFVVPLVKSVQELRAENQELKKELTELRDMVTKLRKTEPIDVRKYFYDALFRALISTASRRIALNRVLYCSRAPTPWLRPR